MILLHDNASSHTAKLIKETIEAFGWETFACGLLIRLSSDYHLFASTGHALAALHFLRRCMKMAR